MMKREPSCGTMLVVCKLSLDIYLTDARTGVSHVAPPLGKLRSRNSLLRMAEIRWNCVYRSDASLFSLLFHGFTFHKPVKRASSHVFQRSWPSIPSVGWSRKLKQHRPYKRRPEFFNVQRMKALQAFNGVYSGLLTTILYY